MELVRWLVSYLDIIGIALSIEETINIWTTKPTMERPRTHEDYRNRPERRNLIKFMMMMMN